jgi:hypothetical protein
MATTTPAQQTAIANLYVALYNRAPDATGFEFWSQALGNGASLFTVATSFVSSPEAVTVYPASQTAQQFVSSFYQTVFRRAPDAEGLAFWTGVLNDAGGVGSIAGKATVVSKIIEIVSTPLAVKPADMSAVDYAMTAWDRDVFSRKIDVSLDFATHAKSNDLVLAKQVLENLFLTQSEPDLRKTFTLGTGGDTFNGGPANDTFNAPDFGGNNSLNTHDDLNGGAGIDTLNARLAFQWREIPSLNDIEVVKVTTLTANAELDLRNSTGVTHVGFTDGAAGSSGLIYNVGAASLSVANQTSSASFTGSTATALSLSLSQVGTAGSLTTVDLARWGSGIGTDGNGAGAKATTHNIDMSTAYVALAETKASAAVIDVNVAATGTNALTLSSADALTVKHLTVTGNGAVDFSGRALASLETFTGGSGAEKLVTTGALSASARIDLGAGNDTITLGSGSVQGATVNGGSGDDTIVTGAVTHNVARVAISEVQFVTVGAASGTPDASADTISLTILGQEVTTGAVDINSGTAVASAIKSAIDAQGTLATYGFRASAVLDMVFFTFSGDGSGVDQPLITYNGNADGGHGSLTLNFTESIRGTVLVPGVVGTVDTLTGGAGADTFAFTTADVSSTAGAVTAIITDFVSGTDSIKLVNAAAGTGANFVKAGVAAVSLDVMLTAADLALNGTIQYYVGQVGADAYLVTDLDGMGYTNVIKLAGVGLAGINAGDVGAFVM